MSQYRAALLFILLAFPWPAGAQSLSAVSTTLKRESVRLTNAYPTLLRKAHNDGDVAAMTRIAKLLLAELTEQQFHAGCCNYETHYFEVAFIARDDKNAETLARILIHEPDPERAVLPGLKGTDKPLYTVFVDESLSVTFRSSYDLERVENPLIKESADFIAGVVGKLALPVAAAMRGRSAGIQGGTLAADYATAVTLLSAVLPHGRAKITEKLAATEPAAYEGAAARARYLAQFEGDRLRNPGTFEACGPFATSVSNGIAAAIKASCSFVKPDDDCVKAMKAAVTAAFPNPGSCPAEHQVRIARAFNQLAQAAPRTFAATTTLANTPMRYASFSLGTAVIGDINTKEDEPKAKLSNGTIVADTFPKLIVQGLINYMPWGYDPEQFSPSQRERVRFVFGIAFAPYFGASGGVGYAVTRAIGVQVSRAVIWYDTPKDGRSAIDQKPSGENVDTPFRAAHTSTWIFGVTYTFK